jgi:hypothetical protein
MGLFGVCLDWCGAQVFVVGLVCRLSRLWIKAPRLLRIVYVADGGLKNVPPPRLKMRKSHQSIEIS